VVRRLLITVAFIGAAAVFSGALPLARFTGETIVIELLADRILVDGTYVYENPFPFTIRQGMTVPLPPGNEAIGLNLTRDGHVLPLRHILGAYRFELPLRAHERTFVRLQYEQYTPSHSATYLLTTTAPWHRPIDHGLYLIRTRGYRVVRSSYALTNGAFERWHFMPPADWSFAWQ
jgi:hypothetical protein